MQNLYRLCLIFSCLGLAANALDLELDGSFKSIMTHQRLRQIGVFPYDDSLVAEQRLRLKGSFTHSWLYLEVAKEASLNFRQPYRPTPAANQFAPESAWPARWVAIDEDNYQFIHRFDRLFAQLSFDSLQITIGKQAVSEGVGKIFNAVSQVPRQPLVLVDPEWSRPEDALSLVWNGPFTIETRYLPRTATQRKDNFHLRAKGTSSTGYDIALTTGKSDDKPYVGVETAGNLGESLLYAELVGYEQLGTDYLQWLIGLDHAISSKLRITLEAFYNGFGAVEKPYLFSAALHRSTPFRGRWYGGMVASWEATERLRITQWVVVNCADISSLWHLYSSYSLSNNTEFLLGQFLSVGDSRSEFGGKLPIIAGAEIGVPDLTYAAFKWYF